MQNRLHVLETLGHLALLLLAALFWILPSSLAAQPLAANKPKSAGRAIRNCTNIRSGFARHWKQVVLYHLETEKTSLLGEIVLLRQRQCSGESPLQSA